MKKTIDSDKRAFKKEQKLTYEYKNQIRELEMSKDKIDKSVKNIKSKLNRYTEMKEEITDDTIILEYKRK